MAWDVLIVDDSAVMRQFIRRVAALSGIEVSRYREAGDGFQALAALEAEKANLVLTDLNMPGMDGEEMVRRMRSIEALASIPVIVISTDATASRMNALLALGACGYLQKPFGPEMLLAELQRVMGGPV